MSKRKKSKGLKVYYLTSSNAGTAYYRMWQFKESMNRQKIAEAVMPWFHSNQQTAQEWQWHVQDDPMVYARTGLIPSLVAQANVVVVQYLHTWEALALVEALKACNPHVVFLTEIDDWILDTPIANAAFTQYQPGSKYRDVVVEQMRALDGIVCSTPFLAEAYKEFNPHTYVVPNGINFDIWDKVVKSEHKGDIRIGWAGAGNHEADLATIEKPIKELLSETRGVSFHVVHGIPESFKDQSKIVTHKGWWQVNKYPRQLGRLGFDIGVAPLVDNNFNRGKSNLRKLEYAGMKVPVVASRVGHFAETVKHAKDGFLYETPEEFKSYLKLLIEKPELRRMMGQYNYLDVKSRFNVDKIAKDYVEVLTDALARGQTTTVDVSDPRVRSNKHKWIAPQPSIS